MKNILNQLQGKTFKIDDIIEILNFMACRLEDKEYKIDCLSDEIRHFIRILNFLKLKPDEPKPVGKQESV